MSRGAADATTRNLLRLVADANLEGERPRFGEVADALELSHRELQGLATEINIRFRRMGGGMAAFLLRPDPTVDVASLPPDEDPWRHHLFFMPDQVATQIATG